MRMPVLLLLALPILLFAGCVHLRASHVHEVEFNATLVSGDTGAPASGAVVSVFFGEELIYEGTLDENGSLAFSHVFACRRSERPGAGARLPREEISVVFRLDAGPHGMLEIPVNFGHGRDAVALGELRLVPSEEP